MVQRFILPTSLVALVAACSVLIDVDTKQCTKDSDCAALSGAPAGAVCVQSVCVAPGSPSEAGAAGQSSGPADPFTCAARDASLEKTVTYTFAPVFAMGGEPPSPKPFTIKACQQLDFNCDNPVFGPVQVSAGMPEPFTVPTSFAGYFEITNPDTLGGLLFMSRPVIQDTVGWNVTMPTPDLVTQLQLVTGVEVNQELGLILAMARSCAGTPTEGVSITNTKGGLSYYFTNNLPDTSLTKTSTQGVAGFANIEITTTNLSGVNESGQKFGPAPIRVRPHFMSFVELWPTP